MTTLQYVRQVFAALALGFLAACGGGGGGSTSSGGGASGGGSGGVVPPPTAAACGVESQKQFVLDVARDWYRWYGELAQVSPDDYASAEAFLAAITAPLAEDLRDPGFSYLTTASADDTNFSTGAYIGFGFRFAIDASGRFVISDVFEGGAAGEAGFVRGARLLAVDAGDGFRTMEDWESRGATSQDIFGPSISGIERGFRLLIDGREQEVVARKRTLEVPPLAQAPRFIERPGLPPVGYVHLRSFTRSAIAELETLFLEIKQAGTTDFIVDLRYNGGGSLDVAERFADLLGGAVAPGATVYQLVHNNRHRDADQRRRLAPRAASVEPNRIAFLTSGATGSASEMLINGLAPYMELVLVGGDTLGKAVGQYAFDQQGCDTRLRLVSFDVRNGDGLGEYYTGLVDTGRFTLCAVVDSYDGAFGSAGEPLLATALGWLDASACPSTVAAASTGRRALRRDSSLAQPAARPDRRSPWVQ